MLRVLSHLSPCPHVQADTAATSSEAATNEARRAKTSLEKAVAIKQMAEEGARKAANAGEYKLSQSLSGNLPCDKMTVYRRVAKPRQLC
jgi:hypothetical protein